MGGTNDKNNLILLTAKEHFIAHQLLVKMYPEEIKLVFALRMMCAASNKHIRNNKEYEWIRKCHAEAMSISQKGKSYGFKFPKGHQLTAGENNGMFGKRHSNETKEKQSKKAKERSPEIYKGPKSESHIQNIIKSKRLRKYKLVTPDGTEYILDSIADASKLSGVSISILIKLAGNRYKFEHCRNWKISAIPL
jgi:hypothetical protein